MISAGTPYTLHLKGMRKMLFQLSGFFCRLFSNPLGKAFGLRVLGLELWEEA